MYDYHIIFITSTLQISRVHDELTKLASKLPSLLFNTIGKSTSNAIPEVNGSKPVVAWNLSGFLYTTAIETF